MSLSRVLSMPLFTHSATPRESLTRAILRVGCWLRGDLRDRRPPIKVVGELHAAADEAVTDHAIKGPPDWLCVTAALSSVWATPITRARQQQHYSSAAGVRSELWRLHDRLLEGLLGRCSSGATPRLWSHATSMPTTTRTARGSKRVTLHSPIMAAMRILRPFASPIAPRTCGRSGRCGVTQVRFCRVIPPLSNGPTDPTNTMAAQSTKPSYDVVAAGSHRRRRIPTVIGAVRRGRSVCRRPPTPAVEDTARRSWNQAMALHRCLSAAGIAASRNTVRQLFAAVPVWVAAITDTMATTAPDAHHGEEVPRRCVTSSTAENADVATAALTRLAVLEEALGGHTVSIASTQPLRVALATEPAHIGWEQALQLLCGVSAAWPWDAPYAAAAAVPPTAIPEVPEHIVNGHASIRARTVAVVLTAIGHAARFAATTGDWHEALNLLRVGAPYFRPDPTDHIDLAALRREHHLRAGACAYTALAVFFSREGTREAMRIVRESTADNGHTFPDLTPAERTSVLRGAVGTVAAAFVLSRWALKPCIESLQKIDVRAVLSSYPISLLADGGSPAPNASSADVAADSWCAEQPPVTAMRQLRRCVMARRLAVEQPGSSATTLTALAELARHRYFKGHSAARTYSGTTTERERDDERSACRLRTLRDERCFDDASGTAGLAVMRALLMSQESRSPAECRRIAHIAFLGIMGLSRPNILTSSETSPPLNASSHIERAAECSLLLAALLKARRRSVLLLAEPNHPRTTRLGSGPLPHSLELTGEQPVGDLQALSVAIDATAATLRDATSVTALADDDAEEARQLLADVALRALAETPRYVLQQEVRADRQGAASSVARLLAPVAHCRRQCRAHCTSRTIRRVRRALYSAGLPVREVLREAPDVTSVETFRTLLVGQCSLTTATVVVPKQPSRELSSSRRATVLELVRSGSWQAAIALFSSSSDGASSDDKLSIAVPVAAAAAAVGAWAAALAVASDAFVWASFQDDGRQRRERTPERLAALRHVCLFSCASASRHLQAKAVLDAFDTVTWCDVPRMRLCEIDMAVRRVFRPRGDWVTATRILQVHLLLKKTTSADSAPLPQPAAFLSAATWCLWQPSRGVAPLAWAAGLAVFSTAIESCSRMSPENAETQRACCVHAAVITPCLRLQLKCFRWEHALALAARWVAHHEQHQASTAAVDNHADAELISRAFNACALGRHGRATWAATLTLLNIAAASSLAVPDVGLRFALKAALTAPPEALAPIHEVAVRVASNRRTPEKQGHRFSA